jgi:uncharacterized damage-inducible protein DinB
VSYRNQGWHKSQRYIEEKARGKQERVSLRFRPAPIPTQVLRGILPGQRGDFEMNPIQPEQAAFLLQLALPAAKNEHRTTRSVIEAIPPDKGDYRPDPISKSAMELAWHIVAAEHRFYSGIVAGQFDFTPNHRPETVRIPADIGQWYGSSFSKNFEELSALQGDQLSKPIDFRGMFQLPAVAYFEFSLRHSIHHRGQLSAYLRAMGGKVPAIYGESYDSAEAKKAAQAG